MKKIIDFKIEKDRKQNTIILMWNPSISSYTMDNFENDLIDIANDWIPANFNWSVWDHEKAREGDKFFMVKVGPGINGIVMSGIFSSEPYPGEDWSGKGRQVFYIDMEIKEMIHPDRCPLLTSEKLATEIPDFVWTNGHSGQLLTEEQADKLQDLWDKYLNENSVIFEPRAVRYED